VIAEESRLGSPLLQVLGGEKVEVFGGDAGLGVLGQERESLHHDAARAVHRFHLGEGAKGGHERAPFRYCSTSANTSLTSR
jgi:hypothetical protein